jgi:hypothetical protein
VAVSQAAFSGSLVDRAQPLLNQAMFKIRLTTRSSSGMNTEIIAQLQAQANAILAQIESGVAIIDNVYEGLVAQFNEIQSQISGIVSGIAGQAGQILTDLLGQISGLWGSIFGRSSKFDIDAIIAYVQGLIGQLDIPAIIRRVAQHFGIPTFVAEFIIDNFFGSSRMSKGWWENITEWISGGAAAIWNQFAELFDSLLENGANQFSAVQALAEQFLANAVEHGQAIAGQAAQQLLDFITPYAQDLGQLYTQVEAQVAAILGNLGSIGAVKTY